jgi:hypothetical protein
MAGAILAPGLTLVEPSGEDCFKGEFLINNGDTINEGDLVGIVTSGGVTYITPASKTQGAIVKALGCAFFPGNNGTNNVRVGDGTTQKCAIARKAIIQGANTTMVPAFAGGLPVYLGPTPTTSVSNYTCTKTATNGDALQQVGYVSPDGVTIEVFVVNSGLQYQTAGNSTVNFV